MTIDKPVEPSAVIVPDGARRPTPSRLAGVVAPAQPVTRRKLVPSVVRAVTTGSLGAASALAVAAIAAVKAAEIAGRLTWPGGGPARRAVGDLGHSTAAPVGGVRISWTHVEIRWPSES